ALHVGRHVRRLLRAPHRATARQPDREVGKPRLRAARLVVRSRDHPVPERTAATSDLMIPFVDPRTGRTTGQCPTTSTDQVPGIVARARAAQMAWYDGGLRARKDAVQAMRKSFLAAAPALVKTLAGESGRPEGDI